MDKFIVVYQHNGIPLTNEIEEITDKCNSIYQNLETMLTKEAKHKECYKEYIWYDFIYMKI